MDGATDVQGGRISTGSQGGDGRWDAHAGSSPGVRSAPGHGVESFDALNAYLERRCLDEWTPSPGDVPETIGQRMERDLDALLPLPPVAYDACDKQAGRVSSLSLVRYRTNDYSVPVAYG